MLKIDLIILNHHFTIKTFPFSFLITFHEFHEFHEFYQKAMNQLMVSSPLRNTLLVQTQSTVRNRADHQGGGSNPIFTLFKLASNKCLSFSRPKTNASEAVTTHFLCRSVIFQSCLLHLRLLIYKGHPGRT